jgi:hypothetical protein
MEMKIGSYPDRIVRHSITEPTTNWYVIYSRSDGGVGTHTCYSFIIAGNSEEDAIARFKDNLRNVVKKVESEATESDRVKVPWYSDPPYHDLAKAKQLQIEISKMQDEMEDRDSDFELDRVFCESRMESIVEKHKQIAELTKPIEHIPSSVVENRLSKVLDMLSERFTTIAIKLDTDRAIEVAYFDDGRGIINYYPS